MAKVKNEDKPWVDNYPPLKAWLRDHGARCNWQLPRGNPEAPVGYVESYTFPNGREAIVVVHANKNGWEVYTSCSDNLIAATLADADARLGLAVAEDGPAEYVRRKDAAATALDRAGLKATAACVRETDEGDLSGVVLREIRNDIRAGLSKEHTQAERASLTAALRAVAELWALLS